MGDIYHGDEPYHVIHRRFPLVLTHGGSDHAYVCTVSNHADTSTVVTVTMGMADRHHSQPEPCEGHVAGNRTHTTTMATYILCYLTTMVGNSRLHGADTTVGNHAHEP